MIKKHAIIPIFISHHGCPNDCAFCNQKKITAHEKPMSLSEMRAQVEQYLSTLDPNSTQIELAFYGGSFTGIPSDQQEEYLKAAHEYLKASKIHGIRLSTRPDYMDLEVIERLIKYEVALVELGVQSLDEEVLLASKRGYQADVVYESVNKLRSAGIQVGIQLMIGLPKDTFEKAMDTTEKVISLQPTTLRIYPTLVIQDTLLQSLYQQGTYIPLDLETAVIWTTAMSKRFKAAGIPIIRMGLQPTDLITQGSSVLAGPFHPAFRQLVESRLIRDEITTKLHSQQAISSSITEIHLTLTSNQKTQSLLIGQKRCNLHFFQAHGYQVTIVIDQNLPDGEVGIKVSPFSLPPPLAGSSLATATTEKI